MQDVTSGFASKDIQDNKLMALLSYLSVLVIIPVIAARHSRFAMFHANQGIVLAAIEIIFGIATSILGWIPIVGWLFKVVVSIIGLICLAASILGIVNAVNGKAVKLPVVGDISILSAE